ncbi:MULTISPECIES: biotin/lipoyl-containing protein [Priestia]|jgi:biotin carboxyl carrier protein|uniref:biotin/lipoyl-containing protein n=1 Tax=Priestia TaxID=2800373 RepID=UPI00031A9066|nr:MULTISPECIES: acetyl-CoA carboxylase biotin carboxyl carrier protein subunit [Priestia]RAS75613.1 acetyl-CoA carboxylase biotin carboxyl carrier protein subunit [Priestia endophytica]RAS85595.1 acetyl-CoA carboxylase biotin carboxyl carrier protein subunit [Priestia endophytica]
MNVTADITGVVTRIQAKVGEVVGKQDVLLVCESMKMEIEIPSPCDGVVEKIYVQESDTVYEGDLVIEIK